MIFAYVWHELCKVDWGRLMPPEDLKFNEHMMEASLVWDVVFCRCGKVHPLATVVGCLLFARWRTCLKCSYIIAMHRNDILHWQTNSVFIILNFIFRTSPVITVRSKGGSRVLAKGGASNISSLLKIILEKRGVQAPPPPQPPLWICHCVVIIISWMCHKCCPVLVLPPISGPW